MSERVPKAMRKVPAAMRVWPGAVALAFLALFFVLNARAQQPVQPVAAQPIVDKFVLADTIQPVTAGQLSRAIARAGSDGASALLIELDTPGGLADSMRAMAGAILTSRVPVIVYVAPAGARAGSAGFFLLEAADVAAMAPGTNAGAAHIIFEFGQPDPVLTQKAENDAEAFLRSYVSRRGRNVDAALAAMQSSHAYTAEEALTQHLIDLTAPSDTALLAALDGRENYPHGRQQTDAASGQRTHSAAATHAARESARLAGKSEHRATAAGLRSAVDLSRIPHAGYDCAGSARHADGTAGRLCAEPAADSLRRGDAAGGGGGAAGAGGKVRRARRAGDCRHRVPDARNVDAGGRADSAARCEPMGGIRRERGLRADYSFPAAAGGKRAKEQDAARHRRADGPHGLGNGTALTRGAHSRRRRNLAGGWRTRRLPRGRRFA